MLGKLTGGSVSLNLEDQIRELVIREYEANHRKSDFVPGQIAIAVTGKVYGAGEIENAHD